MKRVVVVVVTGGIVVVVVVDGIVVVSETVVDDVLLDFAASLAFILTSRAAIRFARIAIFSALVILVSL